MKSAQVSRDLRGKHAGLLKIEAGVVKPSGQTEIAGRPRTTARRSANAPAKYGGITQALDRIIDSRGAPKICRMDNGPEFLSHALKEWANGHGIELRFIQPGKPSQNSFFERFNRMYRTEVLDRYVFESLDEVRTLTQEFQNHYNHVRPHRSLGKLTPVGIAVAQSKKAKSSH